MIIYNSGFYYIQTLFMPRIIRINSTALFCINTITQDFAGGYWINVILVIVFFFFNHGLL